MIIIIIVTGIIPKGQHLLKDIKISLSKSIKMPMNRANRQRLANRNRMRSGRRIRGLIRRALTRGGVPRSMKKNMNIHHFKEVVSKGYIGGVNSGSGTDKYISGALEFRLDDCANVADLSAVFDQIRLNKVVVEFIPLVNQMSGTDVLGTNINYGILSNIGVNVGQFYTVIDHDDATALTSKTAIQQYATCRSSPIYKKQTRILTPAFQGTIQQTATVTTTQAKYKQWFDIATPSVRHYGVKYYLDLHNASTVAGNNCYEIKCTYYYSCKEQR